MEVRDTILLEATRLQGMHKLDQHRLGSAGAETADDMHHPSHAAGLATIASCVNSASSS